MGIAKYIANLSKSVSYAAVDKVKEMAPSVGAFTETNSELFKNVYHDIRNYKSTYQKGLDVFKRSKIYEAGDVLGKAIISDIKTGKFYNKEREDQISNKIISGNDPNMGFGDFDTDDNFDLDSSEDNNIETPEATAIRQLKQSARENSDAISMSVAKTGQYIVENQKISTNILYAQNSQAYSLFNKNLNAINDNISNIMRFSSEVVQTHAQNSKIYFEESTKYLRQQTELLQQLVNISTPDKFDNKSKKKISFNDIITPEGIPDLSEYFANVKKNISDQMAMMNSLNGMFGQDSNMLLQFVSNPLSIIPKALVNKIVPKAVEKSMDDFNKSFAGFFGSLFAKLNHEANDDDSNPIIQMVSKVLGIKSRNKKDIDTSRYNKGKVAWTGKNSKALNEVIPKQLDKIISLLSGTPEKVYDYDKGKFISSDSIKTKYDATVNQYVKSATYDMKEEFEKYMKLMTFNSKSELDNLKKDIDKFFKVLYDKGGMFDINSKTIDTDYMKYNVDPRNFKIIRQMFKSAPKYKQQQINANILSNRDMQSKLFDKMEEDGNSIFNYLFNDSNLNEFLNRKKDSKGKVIQSKDESISVINKNNLNNVKDEYGHNVFYYLSNMYRELQYLRLSGGIGSGVKVNNVDRIIDSTGKPYDKSFNINDIRINDDSTNTAEIRRKYEREDRENKAYLRSEKRRQKNNGFIFNASDIDDENKLAAKLNTAIDLSKIDKNLSNKREKYRENPSLIDRLLKADSISSKSKEVIETLDEMSEKPIKFFTNVLDKVDERMYDVIYGSEERKEQGFIGALVSQVKGTFMHLNTWIDDNVLNPIKEKFQMDNFKDLGKHLLSLVGIDTDKLKESAINLFKDENGLVQRTKQSTKNIFKSVGHQVSSAFKNVTSPVTNYINSIKKPKYVTGNDEIDAILEDVYNSSNEYQTKQPKVHRDKNAYAKQLYAKRKQELTSAFNPSDTQSYLDYIINAYEMEHKGKIGDAMQRLALTKADLHKGKANMKKMSLSEKKALINKYKEYINQRNANQDYFKNSNKYLTNGLSDLFGITDDNDISQLNKAIERSMTRDVVANKNNTLKDMGSLSMGGLLKTLNYMNLASNLNNPGIITRMQDYMNNIYNGKDQSIRSVIESKLKKPINSNKNISELVDQFPNLINAPISDTSKSVSTDGIGILNKISDKITTIIDLLSPKNSHRRGRQHYKPSINTKVWSSNDSDLNDEKSAIFDFSKGLAKVIADYMYNNIKPHAKGTNGKQVDKTQVTTLSKGEVVLSKDNVKNISGILYNLLDSINGENTNSKIASDAFYKLDNLKDKFGIGGEQVDRVLASDKTLKNKLSSLSKEGKRRFINIRSDVYGRLGEVQEKTEDILKSDIAPFVQEVGGELLKGGKLATQALFGVDPNDQSKQFKATVADVSKNISTYAPEAIASGLLGGGISLVTGAIGGPLLGAAAGAGISLVKHSEAAQNWLFGEMVNGERQGGLVSKDTISAFKKYFPDMKNYGIVGGIAGLLPFAPFGPIGGILMGSAAGFAKNNSDVQKALFGDTGLISDKSKEKIKKALPKAAAGALVGTMFGPFGLLGNALLGSATGLVSGTDKFKEIMLGTYNPTTKQYEHGILSEFRESFVKPLKEGVTEFKNGIKTFIKDEIFKPFKEFLDPVKQQIKNVAKSGLKGLGKIGDLLFEGAFGVPFHTFISDKVVKPVSNVILKPLKATVNFGKKVISAPFKGLGHLGNKLRAHQIKKGTASDMSIKEINKFRKEHKMGSGDDFRVFDIFGENLSQQGIYDINDKLDYIYSTDKDIENKRREFATNMGGRISAYFNRGQSKQIMKNIRDHKLDKAMDLMGLNGVSIGDGPDILKYMDKSQNTLKNLSTNKQKAFNNATSIINSYFANDNETKTKLNTLLKENNREGLVKLISSKLSKNDAEKVISQLDKGYFNTLNENKSTRSRILSNIEIGLGDHVGNDTKTRIMKHVNSGDMETAMRLLGISIEGNNESELSKQTSSFYKKYQGLSDSKNNINNDLDKVLNQTYDFDQKKKIFKYLEKGQYDKILNYINKLPEAKAAKLYNDIKPLLDKHSEISSKINDTESSMQDLFSSNGIDTLTANKMIKNTRNGNYNKLMRSISGDITSDEKMDLLEYMMSEYKSFDSLDNIRKDKNEKKSAFLKEMSKITGKRMTQSDLDKFYDKMKNEKNNHIKDHYDGTKGKDEDILVKEKEMDIQQTYHHDIVNLFERTIDLLSKAVDPVKKNRVSSELKNKSHSTNPNLREEENATSDLAQKISDTMNDNINHYATGGFVNKTQVATLSKGEAVFTEKNTSKVLDILKSIVDNTFKKKEDDKTVVTDTKGNVVEYIRNSKNELVPNLGDVSTKKAILEAKEEEKTNKSLLSKISGLFGKKKKSEDETDDKKKKKGGILGKLLALLGIGKGLLGKIGGGLFGKLGGGLLGNILGKGIFGKAFGIGGAILAAPQLIKFAKNVAIPVMSDVYKNSFKPWLLNDAVPWLKEKGVPYLLNGVHAIAKELPGMIAGAIKFTFTDLIPTLTSSIGQALGMSGQHGEESMTQRAGTTIGRYIVTGGATSNAFVKNFGKKETEKIAEKGVLRGAAHVIRHPIKSAVSATGRVVVTGVEKAKNVFKAGHTALTGFIKDKLPQTAMEKATDLASKAKNLGKSAVEGFTKNIGEFLEKLIHNPLVAKIIGGDAIEKLSKNFVPKIIQTVSERALKAGANVTGRLAAAASTGGLLNIAWAAADFISGYRNAKNILSLTEEPSFGMKICAGLIKSLSGLFIVTSFIPEKVWANLIIDIVMPIFGKEDKELLDMRKKAQDEVNDYNKQNGTNYDIEQYNKEVKDKKDSIFTKIKNSSFVKSIMDIGAKAGGKLKQGYQWLAQKGSQALNWAKQKISGGMEWLGNTSIGKGAKWLWNSMFGNGVGDIPARVPKPTRATNKVGGGFGNGDVKNGMVYYSQADPQWAQDQYGTGTIKSSACGPTSAAMVISSLTGKRVTPVDAAQYSVSHGFRIPNQGTSWGLFNSIGNEYGIGFNQTTDRNAILQALANKQPVIFSGQGSKPFTSAGHFIVGAGMDGDNIEVNDPISLARSHSYPQSSIFSQMATAFIANKALDGSLVDTASKGSNDSSSTTSDKPQEPEKPSLSKLFGDLGNTVMTAANTLYGFGFGKVKERFGIGNEDGTKISAEQLQKFFPAGKLRDNVNTIIEACAKYGVDPALAASIMMMETGGHSYALDKQNNPAGISGNGGPRTFSTIQEGIDYSVRNLKTTYLDKGLNTIEKIGSVYCPVGASNDPNGTNNQWVPGVRKFYKQLTGKDNLDGSVSAGATNGTDGNSSSESEPEKPSLSTLFSDFSNTVMSAANKFYGFDSLLSDSSASSTPSDGGQIDKHADRISDSWWKKTLDATVTSGINPNRTINGRSSPHFGIDYGAKEGTIIKSPIDGEVYTNKSLKTSYGNYVVIKDSKGNLHYFAHMEDPSSLQVGQKVSVGTTIGKVGQTGNATGPHLHYEVRDSNNRAHYNPNDYLNSYYNGASMPSSVGGQRFTLNGNNFVADPEPVTKSTKLDKEILAKILDFLSKLVDNTDNISKILDVLTKLFNLMGGNTKNEPTNKAMKKSNNNVIGGIDKLKSSIMNSDSDASESLLNIMRALASE